MISLQAKNYEFNSNIYGFEEHPSGYSLNPFNFINNNSAFIDIDFGAAEDFMLFTGAGAIANANTSTITGNVGSNAGAISGFLPPSVVNGDIENGNPVTAKAYEDLKVACANLFGLKATITNHAAVFGNGETVGPGIYYVGSAVEISGTLTLDAQGDPDAMFIFKISGALNSVPNTTVLLAGKASAANVYWIAKGAVGFETNTTMIGTAIAYPGAVSLKTGGSITGSLYATEGDIATASFEAVIPVRDPAYHYLGTYTSNGTPQYVEDPSDVVSAATQKTISNSLPDNYPVPKYNPQYITSNFDTNLKIEGSTDVLVTFVSEGVDAKNALGFYTYDINNPSTTVPTKDDITIIFPNVSELSSGGGLQVGDKVKIGSFEAGTGIGWVLIADAWNSTDQEVGDSAWELYSNPDYNQETSENLKLYNVLLEDTVNKRIILGFEDVLRDNDSFDSDFNDAVFYITASAYEAINTNNVVDITSAFDTFVLSDSALKVGETATVTLTFPEVVANFNSDASITAVNGTLSMMTTDDNIIWVGTFTPSTNIEDATNILTLDTSNTVFEGITVLSTTTSNYEVDTLFPTVLSFALSNSALKAGETATVTLTFSEAVAGFSSDTDITAVNGTVSAMTTDNNIIWTGTFTPTVDTEDASNVLTLSANYTDVAVNAGPSDTTSNYEVETLLPTAAITYNSISPYKSGETIIITATFNEPLLDSHIPKIDVNSSGITSGNATQMTKTATTTYTYNYVVPAGDGTRTISLSNGKDLVGNVITSTPTSGTTFMLDNTMPTASLAYSVGGTTVSSVSANDVVTITATFNENIADSPGMQISSSGVETISTTNMTKVSATSYTYAWTMGTGAGAQSFTLGTGTDTAGNVVTAIPISGATILIDAPRHLTKYGEISIGSANLINKYGALGGTSGLTVSGKRISISTAPDGLTPATASSSAYQIKQDFPDSTDGLYWIANSNINSGTPFKIYADMTTDGGGWTLIMTNALSSGWTYANAIERNTGTPSITANYSIIAWADEIKRSASGFQYMIDAGTRGTHGAIWTANERYSFVNSDNTQTEVTITTKFGTWNYHNGSIEERMPWYSNSQGLITTSINPKDMWWGTLIATSGWDPTPYMNSDCGGDGCLPNPGIIWYWVR